MRERLNLFFMFVKLIFLDHPRFCFSVFYPLPIYYENQERLMNESSIILDMLDFILMKMLCSYLAKSVRLIMN